MKAGTVTSIRVNPRDSQSVLDVLDAAGVRRDALSFAQCTSLALSSLLETARQTGLIPEPDEFQYLNRLGPYIGPGKKNKKTKIANALHDMGGKMRAPAVTGQGVQAESSRWAENDGSHVNGLAARQASPPQAALSPDELSRHSSRLTELLQLRDDDNSWNAALEQEYQYVYKLVYPHG